MGAGARALFYPTLLYNVVRNRVESEFHWWDRVDEVYKFSAKAHFVLLFNHLCSIAADVYWNLLPSRTFKLFRMIIFCL